MSKGGEWENSQGREYRAAFKKATYEAVNIQFRRDGSGGLTKADVVAAAARRGLDVATYVKKLIADDIARKKRGEKNEF
jgi:hypothetical protein